MKANKHEINGYIYVTSDDEPKENDYILSKDSISPLFVDGNTIYPKMLLVDHWFKIILCNNPNLPIQQLTTEEVEYLKSVDSFEVEKNDCFDAPDTVTFYKILIPQETEQPKESIEEVIDRIAKQDGYDIEGGKVADFTDGFEKGYNHAKQTLYTDDEVLDLLLNCISENPIDVRQWFNKNKKQ